MKKAENLIRKFALTWLSNGNNAKQAYLACKPQVTDGTAEVNGAKLLVNTKVQEIIRAAQEGDSKRLNITRETLLLEYEDIKKRNREIEDKLVILSMENQAKLLGLNAPTKQENINTNLNIDTKLTDEEIKDLNGSIAELKSTPISS